MDSAMEAASSTTELEEVAGSSSQLLNDRQLNSYQHDSSDSDMISIHVVDVDNESRGSVMDCQYGDNSGQTTTRETDNNNVTQYSDAVFVNLNASTVSINSSISSSGNGMRLSRLSIVNSNKLSQNEMLLKLSLYYHISNPLKRWKNDRVIPYKLVLQIIKTIIMFVQVLLFLHSNANYSYIFLSDTKSVLNQLFFKGLSHNEYGRMKHFSYFRNDIIVNINHIQEMYYQLPNFTIGGYGYQLDSNGDIMPIIATLQQYEQADLNPLTYQYLYDTNIKKIIFPVNSTDLLTDQLLSNGMDLTFNRFIQLKLHMTIHAVHFITEDSVVECFQFMFMVIFSKESHRNKIRYHLEFDSLKIDCNGTQSQEKSVIIKKTTFTFIAIMVIILCTISISLVGCNYFRGYKLGRAMGNFYSTKLKLKLNWWERRHLFSTWCLLTSFSDVMMIIGSLMKILLEFNVDLKVDVVRVLLGCSLLIQLAAMLRYFSFFKELNTLTRTLNAAFPELLKFLLCTSLVYVAFALSCLVMFGSINEEIFGDFWRCLEVLFSLLNGDIIWMVFRSFNEEDVLIYICSRIFVYVFISLFIYFVINLFMSIVKSAYDDSLIVDRATINEIRRFVFSGPLTEDGVALRDHININKYVDPHVILGRRKDEESIVVDLD